MNNKEIALELTKEFFTHASLDPQDGKTYLEAFNEAYTLIYNNVCTAEANNNKSKT
ncbi:hypothetical protein [Apilactobacillus micheneri]|uniref:hypothetical protein n=1 Tax=Apilactobacillus micheneri TaxID=1899430 RepID=UPI0015E84CC4|nr:hypothetical protein [Apilactobacillus micheneri]